jgi:hypothetical protein
MRVRVSTTVDESLLKQARRKLKGATDSRVIEEALKMLLAHYRAAEIDAAYAVYDEIPLSTPDEWGDLESWREAAGRS